MELKKLITAIELASRIRTTPANIYNQLSRGNEGLTIPQSIKIGRRRLWLDSDVISWLETLKAKQEEENCDRQNDGFYKIAKPTIRRL